MGGKPRAHVAFHPVEANNDDGRSRLGATQGGAAPIAGPREPISADSNAEGEFVTMFRRNRTNAEATRKVDAANSALRYRFSVPARRACLLTLVGFISGCTGQMVLQGTLPVPPPTNTDLTLAVSIVTPRTPTAATLGVAAIIRWTDIATVPGTIVRVSAQRENNLEEPTGAPIHLIGDGTPGVGRDAFADGDGDEFAWDVTGVLVGDYVITVILESPDGESATAVSRSSELNLNGIITVTSALPIPTFNFTAPNADTTLVTGDTFNITWTDNGNANAEALVTLGLDPDADRTNGNEIILLRDDLLSNNGNSGTFTFSFLDENGDTVPDGTYFVFAVVDDKVHDPVERTAVGQLILNP